MTKKILVTFVITLWLTGILAIFFIVQKPEFLSLLSGFMNLFMIIFIPSCMAILAACMGAYLVPHSDTITKLILGTAIGMGIFGLAGFALAALGFAKPVLVTIIFTILTGYFFLTGGLANFHKDIQYLGKEIKTSANSVAKWIPIATAAALGLAFLLALTPPIEDFDALLYHLAVPEWWLRDGGLTLRNSIGYWVPHIVEGSFVFPMVFGVDTASHLIHLLWLVLTALLLWHWARQVWNDTTAWDALAILLTMPSLFWLAGWAYTDYALTFAGAATIFAIWQWRTTHNNKWITLSGMMAGIAMGTKYQSFFIPLVGVLLLVIWRETNLQRLKRVSQFSFVSLLTGSIWYIRNWLYMGNPFYPFVFGGRDWDSFLAQRISDTGTGIGLDLGQLFILPLTATLGTQDTNYFDGRFGPFYLILFPITILGLWFSPQQKDDQKESLWAIYALGLAGILAWTVGVMNTHSLFQGRYLFPPLIPLAIPFAVGLNALFQIDISPLRISRIVRAMLAFTVFVNLINFSLHVVVRHPISVVLGITSRQVYVEERQPGYARAMKLVNELPENANVYFLFEPRSYGFTRNVQPDGLNQNFSHDLWLYKTPKKMVDIWKRQGYTHILLAKDGATFIFESNPMELKEEAMLEQVERMLVFLRETKSGEYILYGIP
ncbi:MAG: glycosyltransferase family 39 protein [Anaerolineales bacterium]